MHTIFILLLFSITTAFGMGTREDDLQGKFEILKDEFHVIVLTKSQDPNIINPFLHNARAIHSEALTQGQVQLADEVSQLQRGIRNRVLPIPLDDEVFQRAQAPRQLCNSLLTLIWLRW
jgi:hypothetical protein